MQSKDITRLHSGGGPQAHLCQESTSKRVGAYVENIAEVYRPSVIEPQILLGYMSWHPGIDQ